MRDYFCLKFTSFPPFRIIDFNSVKVPNDQYDTLVLLNESLKCVELEFSFGKQKRSNFFDKVYVSWSEINKNMFGLFAKKCLKPKEKIGVYSGKLVSKDCLNKEKNSGRYVCEINNEFLVCCGEELDDFSQFAIDASDPLSCFGRYANCPPVGKSNNACLVTSKHTVETRALALEIFVGDLSIKKGEEIYVNYGGNYWIVDYLMKASRDPTKSIALQLSENEVSLEQSYVFGRK
jgi:hypothetical protein